MFEVFKSFFFLGLVSFGGPAAHIGYFRNTFVTQKKWLDENQYADLVALSQFLPGPGSSQVGFAIGYKKSGLKGAVAAFLGFTLPSVALMIAVAMLSHSFLGTALFQSIIHGLKLLAVVVVADAAWGMFSSLCKTKITRLLCIFTAITVLISSSVVSQVLLLVFAAVVGIFALTQPNSTNAKTTFKPQWSSLITFVVLGILAFSIGSKLELVALFRDFFQAGSLVFGGGHVVLPLLQQLTSESITQDNFLTGYAAAQAIPGPMFTFATYLGYLLSPQSPLFGAFIATIAIFLPGFLLLLTVLKEWHILASSPRISGALKGINAAVVGFLISALYYPIFTSAVGNQSDFAFILGGLVLIRIFKLPIVALVALAMLSGVLLNG